MAEHTDELFQAPEPKMYQELSNSRKLTCIWLCVTSGGAKEKGMIDEIHLGKFQDALIVTSPAHLLDEATYNHLLTQTPELIAVVKTLQRARPTEMDQLRPALINMIRRKSPNPDLNIGNTQLTEIMHGQALLVANDVILQIFDTKRNAWIAFNKYHADETGKPQRPKILQDWTRMLTSVNEAEPKRGIQLRFLCGAAAFNPTKRRGAAGQIELPFQVAPLTVQELNTYIAQRDDHKLLSTNGGFDWLDDPLLSHIMKIGKTRRNAPGFNGAITYFTHVIKGHVPGLNSLLAQALEFSLGNAKGNETGTVNSLMTSIFSDPNTRMPTTLRAFLNERSIQDTGQWSRWHPKIPV